MSVHHLCTFLGTRAVTVPTDARCDIAKYFLHRYSLVWTCGRGSTRL